MYKRQHALDAGAYKRATRLLERALALAPNLSDAQNKLALSCFLEGDAERGLQVVRALLTQEPHNIHALCNLILFSEPKAGNEEVQAALDTLCACKAEAPDEAYKAALTFCEVGDQAHALAWLEMCIRDRRQGMRLFRHHVGQHGNNTLATQRHDGQN